MSYSCKYLYEIINKKIFKEKVVVISEDVSDNNKINKYLKKNVQSIFLEIDFLKKETSLTKDQIDCCLEKGYANKNNIKEINRNTNGYYNSIGKVNVLYPMIFINGMNIGIISDFERMIYFDELDLLL